MDDAVLQRVVQQHGVEVLSQHNDRSLLQSLPLHASFDHGYFLLVKAIQELRDKKGSIVTVGIGGPSGSGKSSLAAKVASMFGGIMIPMENYRDGVDDANDFESMDFNVLVQNLEELLKGHDIMMPEFDFQQKKRVGFKPVKTSETNLVIVDGPYALHSKLRSFLDIRVAVVGGLHFSLLSKVRHDIGESCSLDYLIDSIFPLFRKHIEPDLHHAQIRINNSFVSSFREPYYKLKCERQYPQTLDGSFFESSDAQVEYSIEMYLRPPFADEMAKISDWIKVRQCGIKYYLSLGDQRIVDKNFIIRPKVEFEVGKTTLGGLLALGYQVVASFKRESTIIDNGKVLVSLESIDNLGQTFIVVKGTNRKVLGAEVSAMGLRGPWITKSYLEMIMERKGVPRLSTPPLPSSIAGSSSAVSVSAPEKVIISPQPIRLRPLASHKNSDMAEPWTRSPTKYEMDPVVASWHVATALGGVEYSEKEFADSSAFRDAIQLVPMPDSYDLDRGLLLAVQAVQTLLDAKGLPVIVGIGGPSGSGKTSLAHKMANIVGCEVISLESYYKTDQIKDFKFDDFSSLDLPLLLKNIQDIRTRRTARIPLFDFEKCTRSGFRSLEVSEDCGVVIFEGVYALHPDIRTYLDIWIAVIGGVHSHLVARVQRDMNRIYRPISQNEIMTTVFPMFQQYIEPHLVHAHLKIRNDFDPVHSPESSLFVLKSNKKVPPVEIIRVLGKEKMSSTVQNFTDIYLRLPNLPSNGQLTESDCIRVRMCEGRFALLIREPIREGNFIVQPKVDFDISVRTVAGLLNLGYQAVAYIEATTTIYQDDKLLIELDHLQDSPSPYMQIKGSNKEAVAAAGLALNLEGTYTTKTYLQIILENMPVFGRSFSGMHDQQAARLQELVDYVQSQGGNSGSEVEPPVSPGLSMECIIEELQSRIKRLERWHMFNTVLWTFLISALIGYAMFQRKRRMH
uniref:Putative P-loop containing nucleoside triphosphate hydrolases superfamily protein n=1 Tax=Hesperocyparis bakeri TaxID=329080 RepID=A0A3S6KLV7_9CONI|nr:putative P-loop containing nucleoside triphosphate hydrolases superfamily protein [Hesperocyparis bakeri]